MAVIMRSVWSRDSAGWCSTVGPDADSPASIRHDFTCALATGISYSMERRFPPRIANGASVLPLRPMIDAPICCNGCTMRPMGRERREPSPVSTDRNPWLDSKPDSKRIDVPLLPASSMSLGSWRFGPRPSTWKLPSSPNGSMLTPMARRQAAVERTSAPSEMPVTVALPLAMAFRISERWDTDLSPGTASAPASRSGLRIVCSTLSSLHSPLDGLIAVITVVIIIVIPIIIIVVIILVFAFDLMGVQGCRRRVVSTFGLNVES